MKVEQWQFWSASRQLFIHQGDTNIDTLARTNLGWIRAVVTRNDANFQRALRLFGANSRGIYQVEEPLDNPEILVIWFNPGTVLTINQAQAILDS